MKNYLKLMVIGLFLLGAASSCEDKFTEEDSLNAQTEIERLRDSLKRAGGIVNYTIHIINGTDASVGSKAGNGLAGASVTISQWGIVKTEITNEQGMVVFPDLRIGKIAVDVNLDGYTPMSFIASLSPEGQDGYNFNGDEGMRNAATQVPIFALTGESTSTVKGKVTIDSDLTNNSPEPAANVNVAMVLIPIPHSSPVCLTIKLAIMVW
ncbi:MAG TPA: carboxypeptidase-like regulatory domain-containing protein, partial [Tenuifilaceae bacterium]|nr:carboxypeptidase-like regulatory domain-containing protein [Tenuifilaceae bacterium]